MNPILRNILAVIAGIVIGGAANFFIVKFAATVPAGVDPMDMESIKAHINEYEFKHFIVPLLAHAIGTLIGAFIAVKLAASGHKRIALVIGVWFLIGGIVAATMIPAPTWFLAADLILAYIPMALLGHRLAS